jgi:hypothetical protein
MKNIKGGGQGEIPFHAKKEMEDLDHRTRFLRQKSLYSTLLDNSIKQSSYINKNSIFFGYPPGSPVGTTQGTSDNYPTQGNNLSVEDARIKASIKKSLLHKEFYVFSNLKNYHSIGLGLPFYSFSTKHFMESEYDDEYDDEYDEDDEGLAIGVTNPTRESVFLEKHYLGPVYKISKLTKDNDVSEIECLTYNEDRTISTRTVLTVEGEADKLIKSTFHKDIPATYFIKPEERWDNKKNNRYGDNYEAKLVIQIGITIMNDIYNKLLTQNKNKLEHMYMVPIKNPEKFFGDTALGLKYRGLRNEKILAAIYRSGDSTLADNVPFGREDEEFPFGNLEQNPPIVNVALTNSQANSQARRRELRNVFATDQKVLIKELIEKHGPDIFLASTSRSENTNGEEYIRSQNIQSKGGSNNNKNITKPATKPKTPATKPKTPATKPKTPATKPKTPVAKPKTPVAKPKTPVAKPKTPVAKPKTPVAKPKTPVAKPKTPVTKSRVTH